MGRSLPGGKVHSVRSGPLLGRAHPQRRDGGSLRLCIRSAPARRRPEYAAGGPNRIGPAAAATVTDRRTGGDSGTIGAHHPGGSGKDWRARVSPECQQKG